MGESIGQLLFVLVIFAGVLFVTYLVTKWISGYQKGAQAGSNVKIIETVPISNGKYIQIVRIGDRYVALGVWKDGIVNLCEVDEQTLIMDDKKARNVSSFKSILSGVTVPGKEADRPDACEAVETDELDNEES